MESADGRLYYVKEDAGGWDFWLSTEMWPAIPTMNQSEDMFGGYYQIGSFFRKIYPFNFWKVKSGKSTRVSKKNLLVRDWLAVKASRQARRG